MAEHAQNSSDVESAVRNLLSYITNNTGITEQQHQPPQRIDTVTSNPARESQRPNTVHQEMQRAFPATFKRGRTQFKRKAPESLRFVRPLEFHFFLMPDNTSRTPKNEEVRMQAGLGRRTIHLPDDADHAQITRVLYQEYPKLRELRGGCLLHKATGGSGRRTTTPLPQASTGYTAKSLKSSSNNGKNTVYIFPLQEHIDTTPLPFDAPEFANMQKNACMTCGTSVPIQLLSLHIESCHCEDLETSNPIEENQESAGNSVDCCPICGEHFDLDLMPIHASSCGDSLPHNQITSQTPDTVKISDDERPGTSASLTILPQGPSVNTNDDWKTALPSEKAVSLYRIQLLQDQEEKPILRFKLDLREDVEDQEERLITFYKCYKVDWTRPFHCRLAGDVAIGEGVKRHFFSLVMQKLQTGFCMDFGNRTGTLLFEGQAQHLIPSTAKVFLQSDLFIMAGRMIGHSFIHGGPMLCGISPAILHVLLGGSVDTATIVFEDIADLDIREILQEFSTDEISEAQKAAVNNLAVSWDLPVLTSTNRVWLLQNLLQNAVLGRTAAQITQLRHGFKETLMWPMLEARPDVASVVFPSSNNAECNAQMVLQNIIWPTGEDGGIDVQVQIAAYLRQFVESGTQDVLKKLVKFWVGWEVPLEEMRVEIVEGEFPTSSTCLRVLRLPGHYATFDDFQRSLISCIDTVDFGFGLV
ncbi:uncharacterized protein LOC130906327 isoform X2 [Corythoichthys intestinalis]|uniref:uncharacterized protein LOC130906327 isoform X2 n=1 Tax=Corythoichthys intestinalis TaxID=161448 RepID=UPI0025A64EE8|nr:uncharacterized protein LOC130906327 isoform X2 [Corythoichthys intestinalis]